MISSRFLLRSLLVAGFARLVYTIVIRSRKVEAKQFRKDLREWESEGGNLAPTEALLASDPEVARDTFTRS